MRVFLYTPFYPPQSQAAAIRCYWLGQALKSANHNVEIFSSVETNESKRFFFNPADNKQGFAKRLIFEFLTGVELFIRILFSFNNLYVLSSPPFIAISIGHLACRLTGKKYVIDVRDIYPDVYFSEGLIKEQSLLGKLAKWFTKSMYQNAHGVMSVTPGLVDKIKTLAPKANVKLLINGYDRDLFRPAHEKFEDFTVIFHGNMGKVQNIPTILSVARLLESENIDFVFIGDGPQASLFKENVPKNVKYLGPKNYQEIPALISKAHLGFSARKDDDIGADAFPVKAFEYLGVGIPVIMTPKSGVMTKLVKSGIFEFDNREVDVIANKILEIRNSGAKIEFDHDLSRQEVSKKILEFCNFN